MFLRSSINFIDPTIESGLTDHAGHSQNPELVGMHLERLDAFMTALLAVDFLKGNPGSTIVFDLRSSKVLPETTCAKPGVGCSGALVSLPRTRTILSRRAAAAGSCNFEQKA